MADQFKKHIEGYRKGGKVCSCCMETAKKESRRMARRRLKHEDRNRLRDAE